MICVTSFLNNLGSSPIEVLILWITSAQLVLAAFATVWPFLVKCTTWGKVMALYSSSLDKVLISSTFYSRLFCTKEDWAAFLFSQFGFVILCQKNIGTKAAHKMLMNFT